MRGVGAFGLQPKHFRQAEAGSFQFIVQPVYLVPQFTRGSRIWRIRISCKSVLLGRATQEGEERRPLMLILGCEVRWRPSWNQLPAETRNHP